MVREDLEIIQGKWISDIEDEDPAIPKIEFRCLPHSLLTAPPLLRWRSDFIAPAPMRWDISLIEKGSCDIS